MPIKELLLQWSMPSILLQELEKPRFTPQALRKIEVLLGDVEPTAPPTRDLLETYTALSKSMRLSGGLSQVERVHLRRAPWVIFNSPGEEQDLLGAIPDFTHQYINWLKGCRSPSPLILLLSSFLKHYPSHLPTFDSWMEALKGLLENHQIRRQRRIEIWRNRCDRYGLLEKDGPGRLAVNLLGSANDPSTILTDAGLTGQLENQGLSAAMFLNTLRILEAGLGKAKFSKLLLEKIIALSEKDGNELRFPTKRKRMAEAMLKPFLTRPQGIDDSLRETIKLFLLKHLGDPRLSPAEWAGISNACKRVMLSWLVEGSLQYFFQVLDATADKIWKYRKAFWGAYSKRGYIREAWPVLGSKAQRAIFQHRQTGEQVAFGLLRNASANQSVLLMKIDSLFITEWSHNGTCRIWNMNRKENEEWVSRMFHYNRQRPYSAHTLRRSCDFAVVHRGSQNGRWQRELADYIRHEIGIHIPYSDLMPEREDL